MFGTATPCWKEGERERSYNNYTQDTLVYTHIYKKCNVGQINVGQSLDSTKHSVEDNRTNDKKAVAQWCMSLQRRSIR